MLRLLRAAVALDALMAMQAQHWFQDLTTIGLE